MDMEFYQFHPTGLYKLGILLSEAPAERAASSATAMARPSPSGTRRRSRTSLRADMVSRFHLPGGSGGPRVEGKDYVHLDLTHLPPEVIDEKLPDVTDFARTYLGVEPKTHPVPIQPTAHYAMGGLPTDIDGRCISDAGRDGHSRPVLRGESACVSVHGATGLGPTRWRPRRLRSPGRASTCSST
jgi:succinate dehydrogenase / fumarate reductase flavoprotein subunit